MEGKIVSTSGGVYVVYSEGVNYSVFPRGNLRFQNKKLLVGDNVILDEALTISDVKERTNELIRPKVSNIDLLVITMSTKEPDMSLELIYKFLTYANMNEVPAAVALTKCDLLTDFTEVNNLKEDLKKLGIPLFLLSKKDKTSYDEFKNLFQNKTIVMMGQTGVGKSSLINELSPEFNRLVGEYSLALGRGKHKTKEVVLLPFMGGFIGDTPGFSSLELNLYKEDLAHYFPGYDKYYLDCFYSNCLHQNEKDCRVKEAIENGELSNSAHEVYLKLLSELIYRKDRSF